LAIGASSINRARSSLATTTAAPVVDPGSVASSHCAVFLKGRLQACERFGGCSYTRVLVYFERDGFALLLSDHHRNYLFNETPAGDCRMCPTLALCSKLILRLARDSRCRRDVLAVTPIWQPAIAQLSPSLNIESMISPGPSRYPHLAFFSRKGALLIDSIPPATIKSASPAVMAWAARATAFNPDPQTLLTVNDGMLSGMPAAIAD
jgi:hypothetical protein